MTHPVDVEALFERTLEFPDDEARDRYNNLVGLDEAQARLGKEALIRLHPQRLTDWVNTHHRGSLNAAKALADRPPVFIFAGDVGGALERGALRHTSGAEDPDEVIVGVSADVVLEPVDEVVDAGPALVHRLLREVHLLFGESD